MVGIWSPREKHTTIYFDHENLPKSWPKVIAILLALRALTGCDYTVSFIRKGKVYPSKHLEKNETVQETFGCLGDVEKIDESMVNACKEFACQFYTGKKVKLANELRFDMFLTK